MLHNMRQARKDVHVPGEKKRKEEKRREEREFRDGEVIAHKNAPLPPSHHDKTLTLMRATTDDGSAQCWKLHSTRFPARDPVCYCNREETQERIQEEDAAENRDKEKQVVSKGHKTDKGRSSRRGGERER